MSLLGPLARLSVFPREFVGPPRLTFLNNPSRLIDSVPKSVLVPSLMFLRLISPTRPIVNEPTSRALRRRYKERSSSFRSVKCDTSRRIRSELINPSVSQESLFSIFNNVVRSKPEAREAVLGFFANVVRKNEKRSGMRVRLACYDSSLCRTL
jgi:hypothetical protein